MVNISNNFPTKQKLVDKCEKLNKDELIVSYEQIYKGTLTQQIKDIKRVSKIEK